MFGRDDSWRFKIVIEETFSYASLNDVIFALNKKGLAKRKAVMKVAVFLDFEKKLKNLKAWPFKILRYKTINFVGLNFET